MRVGYKNKVTVDVNRLTEEKKAERAARNAEAARNYGERERGVILDKIARMPEDKRLESLRANGFLDEANALEQEMATRHIHELNGNANVTSVEPTPEKQEETAPSVSTAEENKPKRGRKPKK